MDFQGLLFFNLPPNILLTSKPSNKSRIVLGKGMEPLEVKEKVAEEQSVSEGLEDEPGTQTSS